MAFPVLAIALDAVPVSLAAEHGTQVLVGCLALLGSVSAVLRIALGWERAARQVVGPPDSPNSLDVHERSGPGSE